MAIREIIEKKPSQEELKRLNTYTVIGENILSMIREGKHYEFICNITPDKINPKRDYIVYYSNGLTENPFFEKEHTVIHYIEEVIPQLTKEEKEKWETVRNNAAISMMNALLETTQHSVILEPAANRAYARIAVAYADSLIKELRNKGDWVEKILEV